jgi:hypothetical protein
MFTYIFAVASTTPKKEGLSDEEYRKMLREVVGYDV